jgi:hypothetical protein
MQEIVSTNLDNLAVELAYRRALLVGTRRTPHGVRSRRRNPQRTAQSS